ncbi:MAG: immunoglobulin-like domain-containing protein [Bacteroidales bacterium]
MRKLVLIIAFIGFAGGLAFFSSCTKDDTTAPVITITGDNPFYLVLNSLAYTDPGATAEDDEDGSVTVTNDISATNPDRNVAGEYTITYTAVDAAGNEATATRKVIVYNEAAVLAGTYSVQDITKKLDYTDQVIASTTENRKITFQKFAAYDPCVVYATVGGSGDITLSTTLSVPNQLVLNAGNPAADRQFQGTGTFTTINPFKFEINYTELTNGSTITGKGIYTKN